MIIAVTGGRDFADQAFVFDALNRVERESGRLIRGLLHGACPTGLDQLAAEWQRARIRLYERMAVEARKKLPLSKRGPINNHLWILGFVARWDDLETPPVVIRRRRDGTLYNAAAGSIRNGEMLRHLLTQGKMGKLVAFPGGRGTADCVKQAHRLGILVELLEITNA